MINEPTIAPLDVMIVVAEGESKFAFECSVSTICVRSVVVDGRTSDQCGVAIESEECFR